MHYWQGDEGFTITPVSVNVGNADQLSRVRNLSRAHLFRVFSFFFFCRIPDRKRRKLPPRRVVFLLWLMKALGPDRLYANCTRGSSREHVYGELYMNPIDAWSPWNTAAVTGTVRMSSSKTTCNTEEFHA